MKQSRKLEINLFVSEKMSEVVMFDCLEFDDKNFEKKLSNDCEITKKLWAEHFHTIKM